MLMRLLTIYSAGFFQIYTKIEENLSNFKNSGKNFHQISLIILRIRLSIKRI